METSINTSSETNQILDVFSKGHVKEKNFYRNMAIITLLLFMLDCAIIYLVNFKVLNPGTSYLTGYAILGLSILVVSFGFSIKIYFREKRWLFAIDRFRKDRE